MKEFYDAGNEAIRSILDGISPHVAVREAAIKYNQDENYLRKSVETRLDVHFGKGADNKFK